MPANAVPDSIAMTFVYEKQGQKVEFTADKFPDDFNDSLYKFINRYDKLIRKGKNNEPPIKGFSLSGETVQDTVSGTESKSDLTETVLVSPKVLLAFFIELPGDSPSWKDELLTTYGEAKKKGIPFYFVTSNRTEGLPIFSKMGFDNPQVVSCDFTLIRTAARVSPTLYLLKTGIVEGKWRYPNFSNATQTITK